MKIDVLYFEGCPNHLPAVALVKEVVADLGVSAEIAEVLVSTPEEAGEHRFFGSPSIQVNGTDIDPNVQGRSDYAFSCRIYGTLCLLPKAMLINAVRGNVSSNSPGWKSSLGTVPAIAFAFLPKLACPVCWTAYAGLLSSLGLGFLLNTKYLFPFILAFLVMAVGALAFCGQSRHGFWPFFVGVAASVTVVVGKFLLDANAVMCGGVGLLIVASIWNAWPVRKNRTDCPARVIDPSSPS